jgi:V/A-type H+-transporting ATPase subunit E
MSKTTEKLTKFTEMVMQEASRMKLELKEQAEHEKDELIAVSEIQYLRKAYEKIQESVRKIDKAMNEEISKTILESKQALFNRRDEIINAVFENVKKRIMEFRKTGEYRETLESHLKVSIGEAGEGDIRVLVDAEDLELMEDIRARLNAGFKVQESEELLLGGFLIVNRSKGLIWDHSYISRINEERQSFLEKHHFSIE